MTKRRLDLCPIVPHRCGDRVQPRLISFGACVEISAFSVWVDSGKVPRLTLPTQSVGCYSERFCYLQPASLTADLDLVALMSARDIPTWAFAIKRKSKHASPFIVLQNGKLRINIPTLES